MSTPEELPQNRGTSPDALPKVETGTIQELLLLLDQARLRITTIGQQQGVEIQSAKDDYEEIDLLVPLAGKIHQYNAELHIANQQFTGTRHIEFHASYEEMGNRPNHVRDRITRITLPGRAEVVNREISGPKAYANLLNTRNSSLTPNPREVQVAIDFMKDVLTAEPDAERARAIYEEKKREIGVPDLYDTAIVRSVKLGK